MGDIILDFYINNSSVPSFTKKLTLENNTFNLADQLPREGQFGINLIAFENSAVVYTGIEYSMSALGLNNSDIEIIASTGDIMEVTATIDGSKITGWLSNEFFNNGSATMKLKNGNADMSIIFTNEGSFYMRVEAELKGRTIESKGINFWVKSQ